MDDIVKAALKKWPNVPNCHGWLALDGRGDWYLRDDQAQAAGAFPQVKGSRIEHRNLLDFIGRNYACDDAGRWFFQNGPQRVYVDLEVAPWVWRLQPDSGNSAPSIVSQTGIAASFESAWLDQRGRLFLATDIGFGMVHTLDMESASTAVEQALWTPATTRFEDMPGRFGFVLRPAPT